MKFKQDRVIQTHIYYYTQNFYYNYELKKGQEYKVELAVRDFSITSYIDEKLVNQVMTYELEKGPLAFSVWNGRTIYRRPMIRTLS